MTETKSKFDDESYELDNYTDADYIPAAGVTYHGRYDEKIDAVIRDNDNFGNVLKALMFGDEGPNGTVAVAKRRDDCYNEDGTYPDWQIRSVGSLSVVDTTVDDWAGCPDDDIIRWTFDTCSVQDFETSGDELTVEIWNEFEGWTEEVTFVIEQGDDDE